MLDPKLQDGKKIPKWNPKTWRGLFLGISPEHSSSVGRILNLRTGHVSPQFHVVYDDLFSSVSSDDSQVQIIKQEDWDRLLELGSDENLVEGMNPKDIPPLHKDWLSNEEIDQRNEEDRN